MYKAGSLFSGIGGLDLAFSLAGFDVRWQVEIESYCQRVLIKHKPQYWPNAELFSDVKEVGSHCLEPVDVIFGGFPCQDISVAGQGKGIQEGTRSGLWFEFARIIGDLRPRFVLLENVGAITAPRKLSDGSYRQSDGLLVLAGLAALGYDAEWGIIPAAAVGAPHERKRWWCVAHTERTERRPLDTGLRDVDRPDHRLYARWQKTASRSGGPDPKLAHAEGNRDQRIGVALAGQTHEARIQNDGAKPDGGSQVDELGHSAGEGLPQRGSDGLAAAAKETGAGLVAQSERSGKPALGDSNGARFEEHGWPVRVEAQQPAAERASGGAALESEPMAHANGMGASSPTQPRMVRVFDGLSDRLDRVRRESRWPARFGEQQYEWEPDRTAFDVKNRVARLKALGNAVVPQVALPLAQSIMAYLEAHDVQD